MNQRVALRIASIGKAALWIYTKHILVFTAGAICGAVEAFSILLALGWAP
jgi:hypothetical protein